MCRSVKLTGEGHSQYVGLESAIALSGPHYFENAPTLPYPNLPYPGALPYPKTGKNQTGLASCVRSDCRLLWFPGSLLHHWQTNGSIELITTSSILSEQLPKFETQISETKQLFLHMSNQIAGCCGFLSSLVGARGRRPLWSPYVKSRSQHWDLTSWKSHPKVFRFRSWKPRVWKSMSWKPYLKISQAPKLRSQVSKTMSWKP